MHAFTGISRGEWGGGGLEEGMDIFWNYTLLNKLLLITRD